MFSILTRAGIVEPKVWCGEAKEMERFFAELAGQELDIFIVLGGDGTIRTAAEACVEKGSYLIPLPRQNVWTSGYWRWTGAQYFLLRGCT
jgi:hypothetical protein